MRSTSVFVLAALTVSPSAAARPPEPCEMANSALLPDAGTVTMASSIVTGQNQNIISLYQCVTNESLLTCYLTYNRKQAASLDYKVSPQFLSGIVLFDNFKEPHKATRSYFCTGRGQHQPSQTVNLAQNDFVWFELEFDGGADDIKQARIAIVNPWDGGKGELTGPVNSHS